MRLPSTVWTQNIERSSFEMVLFCHEYLKDGAASIQYKPLLMESVMPTYEYKCESNGRVVEVSHKMAEKVKTWGELCKRAEIMPGKTDLKAPVIKLMSAGFVNTGNSSASEAACELPACGAPMGGCGSGMCGLN
jgi:predicted nucleic acid-binding Zn ribbon protein